MRWKVSVLVGALCVVGASLLGSSPGQGSSVSRPAPTSQPGGTSQPATLALPMVIAHRGACGRLPEHTMEAYRLAIRLGADAIEPDLVSTRDGVLIVRHENELSDTTDVAKRFPRRKRTKMIDGRKVSGWFSEDFTLAEIKTIRATQRLSFRDQSHNGKYKIPTFREVLALVSQHNATHRRKLWVIPELKHPSHFQGIGLALEPKLLKLLRQFKLDGADAPVVVQSFEVSNLKWLHKRSKVKLLQLLEPSLRRPYDWVLQKDRRTYGDMLTDKGLKAVAQYAYGIGPWKAMVWAPQKYRKRLKVFPRLVADAHRHGLRVFAYTFRNENRFLARRFHGSPIKEYYFYFRFGFDAIFSDFPATALRARQLYQQRKRAR